MNERQQTQTLGRIKEPELACKTDRPASNRWSQQSQNAIESRNARLLPTDKQAKQAQRNCNNNSRSPVAPSTRVLSLSNSAPTRIPKRSSCGKENPHTPPPAKQPMTRLSTLPKIENHHPNSVARSKPNRQVDEKPPLEKQCTHRVSPKNPQAGNKRHTTKDIVTRCSAQCNSSPALFKLLIRLPLGNRQQFSIMGDAKLGDLVAMVTRTSLSNDLECLIPVSEGSAPFQLVDGDWREREIASLGIPLRSLLILQRSGSSSEKK